MPKILLVEDDNNLREIFEMRLKAEGYQTVTASNGEEALVVAMKEKPDLIIADVMMPKLSGFEMLETLRAAPEMASTRVIMMTALGQAEDRSKGERLGVIKYLVKSQVTLEDFVRVVREVITPSNDSEAGAVSAILVSTDPKGQINQESEKSMQEDNSQTTPAPADSGAVDQSTNPITDSGSLGSVAPDQPTVAQEQDAVQGQIDNFVSSTPAGAPVTDGSVASDTPASATEGASSSLPSSDAASFGSDQASTPVAPEQPASTDTGAQPNIPLSTPPAEPAPEAPVESEQPSQAPPQ
jgi:DNA-binding response OmpR family regulator